MGVWSSAEVQFHQLELRSCRERCHLCRVQTTSHFPLHLALSLHKWFWSQEVNCTEELARGKNHPQIINTDKVWCKPRSFSQAGSLWSLTNRCAERGGVVAVMWESWPGMGAGRGPVFDGSLGLHWLSVVRSLSQQGDLHAEKSSSFILRTVVDLSTHWYNLKGSTSVSFPTVVLQS